MTTGAVLRRLDGILILLPRELIKGHKQTAREDQEDIPSPPQQQAKARESYERGDGQGEEPIITNFLSV